MSILNGQYLFVPLQILELRLAAAPRMSKYGCGTSAGLETRLSPGGGLFLCSNCLLCPLVQDHRRAGAGGRRHAAGLHREGRHHLRHAAGRHSVRETHLLRHVGGERRHTAEELHLQLLRAEERILDVLKLTAHVVPSDVKH